MRALTWLGVSGSGDCDMRERSTQPNIQQKQKGPIWSFVVVYIASRKRKTGGSESKERACGTRPVGYIFRMFWTAIPSHITVIYGFSFSISPSVQHPE